jgi:hypothetical protein
MLEIERVAQQAVRPVCSLLDEQSRALTIAAAAEHPPQPCGEGHAECGNGEEINQNSDTRRPGEGRIGKNGDHSRKDCRDNAPAGKTNRLNDPRIQMDPREERIQRGIRGKALGRVA